MAIQLGTTVLDGLAANMIWEDEYQWAPVVQTTKRVLGGSAVVHSQELVGARPITLVANTEQGWLTKTQVKALQAQANSAGATFTLILGAETWTVMFDHSNPPALSADPLDQIGVCAPSGYYTAVIRLITL